MRRILLVLAVICCRPQNVSEAEAKGDVRWLEDNGSPEAVAALGHLADKDAKAAEWLESHAGTDTSPYIAAWDATERNAAWGPALLKSALADPGRADVAASSMKRGSASLAQFIAELEGAVGRVEGTRPSTVAAVLASVGAAASSVVERRLTDPKTRGAMCRGIGSSDSSAESRAVLMRVSSDARNDAGCLEAVTSVALVDPKVFDWLASQAETGILKHVGEANGMPCPKLATLWKTAMEKRPATDHGALAIPLAAAIKRCPPDLDAVLASRLDVDQDAPLVIAAVDPFDRSLNDLKATCSALNRAVRNPRIPRRSIERGQDELAHCR